MRNMSQAFLGMLAALISSVLVFGGLTISLAEGGLQAALALPQSPTVTQPVPTQMPGEATYTPSPTPMPTSTPTLLISDICEYPPGWVEVIVDFGDDFASLSARYNISEAELRQSNCLDMPALWAGMTVYVPFVSPTSTIVSSDTPVIPSVIPKPTKPVVCLQPYGWVIYIVRRGDTLFGISTAHGISVQELKNRNCLNANLIRVGQRLALPYHISRPHYFHPYQLRQASLRHRLPQQSRQL
jgi:LysM repeat protein